MDDVHKKEITLMHTTVKIPGLRPRTTKTIPNYPAQHPNQEASNGGLKGDTNHVLKGVCVVMLGSYRKDLFLLYLILIISTDKMLVHRNALCYIMQESEFVSLVSLSFQLKLKNRWVDVIRSLSNS
jgi:hypothetical protein